MTTTEVPVALDNEARQVLREYLHASDEIELWEERKRKAREVLVNYLTMRTADVGTIDDKPVCRLLHKPKPHIDTKLFKEEEPALYRRYARTKIEEEFRLASTRSVLRSTIEQ